MKKLHSEACQSIRNAKAAVVVAMHDAAIGIERTKSHSEQIRLIREYDALSEVNRLLGAAKRMMP